MRAVPRRQDASSDWSARWSAGGGEAYDRAALAKLYGDDVDARPLPATLVRGKAHEQAVAVAVLGEARRTEALPGIARQLVHPYPLVRYYAKRAVDTLADRRWDMISIGRHPRSSRRYGRACGRPSLNLFRRRCPPSHARGPMTPTKIDEVK